MYSDAVALADVPELSDLLLTSGLVRFRITSRSMAPTLRPGDEIFVEPVSPGALRSGDLILFHRGGQLICHRLTGVFDNGTLAVRGDAADRLIETARHVPEELIAREQVLGRVSAIRKRSLLAGLGATLRRLLVPALLSGLPHLQQLKAYRVLMRPLATPFLTYHLGIARGARWYDWQRLDANAAAPRLEPGARPHLLLVKRGKSTVGWASLVFKDSVWQCEHVAVRIRYRGLGIELALTRQAHRLFNGA